MKNPEQFVKSVDILVDAYENGNLRHLSPCNCAVGNLIAYSQGTYDYDVKTGGSVGAWVALMNTIREKVLAGINKDNVSQQVQGSVYFNRDGRFRYDEKIAVHQAELTGYTANEIERIEAAFEKNKITECGIGELGRNSRREDDSIDGLLNAVKVLGDIHEIPEETIHCMKEKIQNKTYKKSFEFQIPEGSRFGKDVPFSHTGLDEAVQDVPRPSAVAFPEGDPANGVQIDMDAVRRILNDNGNGVQIDMDAVRRILNDNGNE